MNTEVGKGVMWLLALGLGKIGELPGEVMRFDPCANRVTATIDAEALSIGLGPGGLWTTGCVECGVHRRTSFAREIDAKSNAPVGAEDRGAPGRLGPLFVGRARVWFGGYEDASETIASSLDLDSRRVDRFLRVSRFVYSGMAFDPHGRALWVARAPGGVLRVDLARR